MGNPGGDVIGDQAEQESGEVVQTTEEVKQPSLIPAIVSIRESVATIISESSKTVKNIVVQKMASDEIEERAYILEEALSTHDLICKKLSRIKREQIQYDTSEKEILMWSKEDLEEKKMLDQQAALLSNLITKACSPEATAQDWDKLRTEVAEERQVI